MTTPVGDATFDDNDQAKFEGIDYQVDVGTEYLYVFADYHGIGENMTGTSGDYLMLWIENDDSSTFDGDDWGGEDDDNVVAHGLYSENDLMLNNDNPIDDGDIVFDGGMPGDGDFGDGDEFTDATAWHEVSATRWGGLSFVSSYNGWMSKLRLRQ